jgi:predicted transcriptional regulator
MCNIERASYKGSLNKILNSISKSVFEIVVVVAVQSNFHLKIYQNKIFYFLKIIFDISTLKRYENIKKIHFK